MDNSKKELEEEFNELLDVAGKIQKERITRFGIEGHEVARTRLDLALSLGQARSAKALSEHTEKLSSWTKKIAILTGVLIIVSLVDICVRVLMWWWDG